MSRKSSKNSPPKPTYFTLIPKEDLEIHFELNDKKKQNKVEELVKPLIISSETVEKVSKIFENEIKLGLMKDPPKKSSLHMLNTFLPELPNGKEEGEFLALDLGGSNFRVSWIHMEKGKVVTSMDKQFTLTKEIQQGLGTQLFDYIANCVKDSLDDFQLNDTELPLGFTFSFPMEQKALDIGYLVSWTKNFNAPGVVGEDVVKMLNDALHKQGDKRVEVVAVLNDMTGILVQGAYLDNRTAIGIGIGTGANASYLEKVENVNGWPNHAPESDHVAIDTEWGAFGDNGVLNFLKTQFDIEVDEHSVSKNKFTFEKYISGNFLGDVVAAILCKLISENLLFPGQNVTMFNEHDTGIFKTQFVSECENDIAPDCNKNTKRVLQELNLLNLAIDDDIAIIRYVCSVTSIRASKLIAACLASLIKRIDRPDVTVAVDGSVYKRHPKIHSLITHYVSEMLPKQKFRLMLAEDGSGKGAGLIAAIAMRLKSHHLNDK
uniref:Phosphotransferase n=1 Tax=Strigamia maritima TaxID=126957 RepID=T1IWW6_STRMM